MTVIELVPGDADAAAAARWVADADRVLIGAGAGLSAAAGFDYTDEERFEELFPALRAAGLRARTQLIGHPLPPRYQWGFWAVHVDDIRLRREPSPLYLRLRELVGDRDYFVLSSNVDALFTRNGFDSGRVYTPQGDYALYQCLTPCTREVWNARPVLHAALDAYDPATGAVHESAVPTCPYCGGPVHLNVFAGRWYINDHFATQREALRAWLRDAKQSGDSVAVVEIGAGFNTPGVVRHPIEGIVDDIRGARLIRVNRDHAGVPPELAARSASLSGEAAVLISRLAGNRTQLAL